MLPVDESLLAALGPSLRLERELTGGGMSRLYLARDLALARDVVVKVLPPDLVTDVAVARFRREVDLTVRLQHPHILPVLSAGSCGDLLFYVSPYIAGESLRDRIARDGALPLEDVERILREVAGALAFAHTQGVVHRDVKPGNVLLSQGHAVLADFGIARAVARDDEALTLTETAPGTPAYLAPERPGDHTADLYALAVVAHEMLTGARPEGAVTAKGILAARRVRGLRDGGRRERALAGIVVRALALHPADRFPTAEALLRAVEHPERHLARETARRARPAALAAVLVAALAYPIIAPLSARGPLVEDRYLVLPFTGADSAEGVALAAELSSAIGAWQGVQVAEVARARRALGDGTPNPSRVFGVARELSASRVVTGELALVGDGAELRATLHDVATRAPQRTVTRRMDGSDSSRARAFAAMASVLLRGVEGEPPRGGVPVVTAWRLYDRGQKAMWRWALTEAAADFREAVRLEPGHAPAHLALAQVLTWEDSASTAIERRTAAERAVALRARLDAREGALAEGLLALADSAPRRACTPFARALEPSARDFSALVGLGDCESRDRQVIRDRRSPSGWTFRGDYGRAATAYERALAEATGPHPEFVHARLRRVLFIESNKLRTGRDSANGLSFRGYPSVVGGRLVFVPHPSDRGSPSIPATLGAALEHAQGRLRHVQLAWVRSDSASWRARRALSETLELMGEIAESGADDVTALGEIRAARRLVTDSSQLLPLVLIEVRQLLKNGDFAAARALADSGLKAWPAVPPQRGAAVASLGALTGRESLVIRHLRDASVTPRQAPTFPDGRSVDVPAPVARARATLYGLAILGGCDRPRMLGLIAEIENLVRANVPDAARRDSVEDALLAAPLTAAAPCLGSAALLRLGEIPDALVRAHQAHARGDRRTRDALLDAAARRLRDHPSDVSIDYVFGEAWLLATSGDTSRALGHLRVSLDALPSANLSLIDRTAEAAGLVRVMELAATIAAQVGDSTMSRRWAAAVVSLWSGADRSLQPALAQMRALQPRR